MSASIEQIWNIVASLPRFVFSPTFIFCSPICSNNCGIVFFLRKYVLVFEKWHFSFDRSNMQIFTVNITQVVWPHVTNVLDLRYFCEHNPLFVWPGGPNPLGHRHATKQDQLYVLDLKTCNSAVTWNVFLTITQENDLGLSITKPTSSTSERFN